SKITGEAAQDLPGTSKSIILDKTNDYRFVFMGSGPYFEGRVYQLPDITTPIIIVSGTDDTYTSGQAGLLAYDNSGARNSTADVTYDNYFASEHDPRLINDDFNDSNDTNPPPPWVHQDPIQEAGVPSACYGGATFTFTNGGYRLFSPVPC